jgi:hypothetical protein
MSNGYIFAISYLIKKSSIYIKWLWQILRNRKGSNVEQRSIQICSALLTPDSHVIKADCQSAKVESPPHCFSSQAQQIFSSSLGCRTLCQASNLLLKWDTFNRVWIMHFCLVFIYLRGLKTHCYTACQLQIAYIDLLIWVRGSNPTMNISMWFYTVFIR